MSGLPPVDPAHVARWQAIRACLPGPEREAFQNALVSLPSGAMRLVLRGLASVSFPESVTMAREYLVGG